MSGHWGNEYVGGELFSADGMRRWMDMYRAVARQGRRPDVHLVDPVVWCWWIWDRERFRTPTGTDWAEFVSECGDGVVVAADNVVAIIKRGRLRRRKALDRQIRRRKHGRR